MKTLIISLAVAAVLMITAVKAVENISLESESIETRIEMGR